MADLSPSYVQSVIAHFTPRVKAEMDRVELEMKAAFPGCSIYRHTFAVDCHLTYPILWEKSDVALAFV